MEVLSLGSFYTLLEIQAALEDHLELTVYGYGSNFDGNKDPEKFKKARQSLLDSEGAAQINLAVAFLKGFCKPTQRINQSLSSYGLKDIAERYFLIEYPGTISYISNGAFIAAAILEGYKVSGSGNPFFNLSLDKKSIRQAGVEVE